MEEVVQDLHLILGKQVFEIDWYCVIDCLWLQNLVLLGFMRCLCIELVLLLNLFASGRANSGTDFNLLLGGVELGVECARVVLGQVVEPLEQHVRLVLLKKSQKHL